MIIMILALVFFTFTAGFLIGREYEKEKHDVS
jgi:hypothetical protein